MPIDTIGNPNLGLSVSIFDDGSQVSTGFDNSIVLVGGYDAANADSSVSPAEPVSVADETDAADLFGADSELARATELAYANGVAEVTAVPVAETTGVTQSFSSTASGTIDDAPIFDPTLHGEHSITAQDTTAGSSVDVSVVYEPDPSTADSGIDLNPITGNWAASSSSSYDITYSYGDYIPAIEGGAAAGGRFVSVLTEAPAHKTEVVAELETEATDFDLHRAVTGAKPAIAAADISSYTVDSESYRLVETAPARATLPDGSEVRLAAGVAARAAASPLGDSLIYENVFGVDTMNTEYKASEASDFSQVTAITRNSEFATAVTTAASGALQDIYKAEIVDEAATRLRNVLKPYAGEGNGQDQRNNLESDVIRVLEGMSSGRPPLLSTGTGGQPYTVDVSLGANDTTTTARVGIEPLDVMKQINLDLAVGDVVTFDGVSA